MRATVAGAAVLAMLARGPNEGSRRDTAGAATAEPGQRGGPSMLSDANIASVRATINGPGVADGQKQDSLQGLSGRNFDCTCIKDQLQSR